MAMYNEDLLDIKISCMADDQDFEEDGDDEEFDEDEDTIEDDDRDNVDYDEDDYQNPDGEYEE